MNMTMTAAARSIVTLMYLCAVALLAGLGLSSMGGCAAVGGMMAAAEEYEEVDIPAEYRGLDGKKVAVLVDAPMEIQYEHASVVPMITDLVGLNIRAYCPQAMVLDTRETLAFQYNNVYWNTMDYALLAKELQAERIVLIDINGYQLTEPGNPYLWDGRASADINVIEAESPDPSAFAYRKNLAVRFPGMSGVTQDDATESSVEQGLQIALSQATVRLFHDHVRTKGDIRDQTKRDTGKRI